MTYRDWFDKDAVAHAALCKNPHRRGDKPLTLWERWLVLKYSILRLI